MFTKFSLGLLQRSHKVSSFVCIYKHMATLYVDSGVRRSFVVRNIHVRVCMRIYKAWIRYTKLGCYHIVMVVRVKEAMPYFIVLPFRSNLSINQIQNDFKIVKMGYLPLASLQRVVQFLS